MVRTDKIRGRMAEKGMTIKDLAKACGINDKTMGRHIATGEFGSDEMQTIVDVLEIEDPAAIFFAKEVT